MDSLVSADWLAQHLEEADLVVVDASWHMAASNRNARQEFEQAHIPGARFLDIDKEPKPNDTFMLDFNKAYNPPCAFSEYTTCPLPPKQNVLKTRIEAGEKYRKQR